MGRVLCETHGKGGIRYVCEHVLRALDDRQPLDTRVITVPLFDDPELVADAPDLFHTAVRLCVPCHARGAPSLDQLPIVCSRCEADWFSR